MNIIIKHFSMKNQYQSVITGVYRTYFPSLSITREEFEILKRKPNLSLGDKRRIIFGTLELGWESEYPPFTLKEVESLVENFGPKIKLAGKIVIKASIYNSTLQCYLTPASLVSEPFIYYPPFYYIVADLDVETWTYKVQDVLKGKPGVRREIMKRICPNNKNLMDYVDKKELEIEINKRLIDKLTNANPGYSRIPGYLTTNRSNG